MVWRNLTDHPCSMTNEEITMTTKEIRAEAHKEITYIFEELLPEHGLPHRPEQVKLSHLMLDAMIEGKIALCDAGTGIGKTFSYLVAGTVYNHYRTRNKMPRQSLIISTSSSWCVRCHRAP